MHNNTRMTSLDTKQFASHTMALFQFIQSFYSTLKQEPELTIERFYNRFIEDKGLFKGFTFANQDTWILFLWGLVALPRETMFEHIPFLDFQSLPEKSWGKWNIEIWELNSNETSRDLKSFVRHIRNSINHGRFSSDDKLIFTFEDRRNNNSQINFRVHADHVSIYLFSKALADGYVMKKWTSSKSTTITSNE